MRTDSDVLIKKYIKDNFAHEDVALENVGSDLPIEERRMQIGADEGKLLYTLVRMIGAKKIIEIGTLNGYSAVWMARALPEGGKLYALEKNYKRIAPSQKAFEDCGVENKIELIEGDALESLKKLEGQGLFDMVFIDADKVNYAKYLDWAEKNVRKGGLVVGDNTLLFGAVYGDPIRAKPAKETVDAMQEFNHRLGDDSKYSGVLIPTAEGLTIAVKEF